MIADDSCIYRNVGCETDHPCLHNDLNSVLACALSIRCRRATIGVGGRYVKRCSQCSCYVVFSYSFPSSTVTPSWIKLEPPQNPPACVHGTLQPSSAGRSSPDNSTSNKKASEAAMAEGGPSGEGRVGRSTLHRVFGWSSVARSYGAGREVNAGAGSSYVINMEPEASPTPPLPNMRSSTEVVSGAAPGGGGAPQPGPTSPETATETEERLTTTPEIRAVLMLVDKYVTFVLILLLKLAFDHRV
ncbi:hypothetical protein V5799_018669, partial [Amblyomma americanum]